MQVPELWESKTLKNGCQKAPQPDQSKGGINIIQNETLQQPDRLCTMESFGPYLGMYSY